MKLITTDITPPTSTNIFSGVMDPFATTEVKDTEYYINYGIKNGTLFIDKTIRDTPFVIDSINFFYEKLLMWSVKRFSTNIKVVRGMAGTGKSEWICNFLKKIEADSISRSVEVCAPAGVAAQQLANRVRTANPIIADKIDTIHSRFKLGITDGIYPRGKWAVRDEVDGFYKITSQKNAQYVIFDEAFNIDLRTLALSFACLKDDCQIVLVGDENQLQPAGFGTPLETLLKRGWIKDIETLTEIHRAKNKDLKDAQIAILENQYPQQSESFEIKVVKDEEEAMDVAENYAMGDGYQCLCPNVEPMKKLGMRVSEVMSGKKRKNDKQFVRGDKVVVCSSNRLVDVVNGTRGTYWMCKKNKQGNNRHFFKIDDLVETEDRPTLGWVDDNDGSGDCLLHAGCLTIHKAQGSGYDKVFIYLPYDSRIINKNLYYVAVTRAKEKVVLCVTKESAAKLARSLMQPAPITPSTIEVRK